MDQTRLSRGIPVSVRLLASVSIADPVALEKALTALATQLPHTPLVIACDTEAIAEATRALSLPSVIASATIPNAVADIQISSISSATSVGEELKRLDNTNATSSALAHDPVLNAMPDADDAANQVQQWYRSADQTALALQNRLTFRRGRPGLVEWIYIFIFVGAVGLESYSHFHVGITAFAYPLGILAAYVLLYGRKIKQAEDSYVSHRTLAEGIRARFFLRILGTDLGSEGRVATLYGPHMGWVRAALRGIDLYLQCKPLPPTENNSRASRAEFAKDNWIDAQRTYFGSSDGASGAFGRMKHCAHRAETISRTLLVLSALFMLIWASLGMVIKLSEMAETLATFAVAVCLVISAIVHSYGQKRGYESIAHRYMPMTYFFDTASKEISLYIEKLKSTENTDGVWSDLHAFARNVADMELLESGDWMLIQREHPAEVRT